METEKAKKPEDYWCWKHCIGYFDIRRNIPFCLSEGELDGQSEGILYKDEDQGIVRLCIPRTIERGLNLDKIKEYIILRTIEEQTPGFEDPISINP